MQDIKKIQLNFTENLKEALLNKTFKEEEKLEIAKITADNFILHVLPYYGEIINFQVVPVENKGIHFIKIETEEEFILTEVLLSINKMDDNIKISNIITKIQNM